MEVILKCLIFSFLTALNLISVTNGYNILVVFPMPANSHYFLGNSLTRALVQAGHDITMVSPFEEKNPPPGGKYTDVLITGIENTEAKKDINFLELEGMNPAFSIYFAHYIGNIITEYTLGHENVKKLLKSDQKFDLVIVEQFCNDAMKVLGWYYNAPVVVFSTVGAGYWLNPMVGNPSPLSYIPDVHLSYTPHMTFWQRFCNTLLNLVQVANKHVLYLPVQNKILKRYFPGSPDLDKIMSNVSLVLLNSHESLSQPIPLVPNMINVGGIHIKPGKGLPTDLMDTMDNAKEGIIYFSMGSVINPAMVKNETRQAIFNALGKLPYKVLIKWHEDYPDKSKNIVVRQWFPQQDILAHPNVKVFITHGGLLSTIETVYFGIPILALPVFGDQMMNAAKADLAGYARVIPFSKLTEDSLTSSLDKLLNDPRYTENAKKRSSLMHDRPMKPVELAIYWLEFVVRHKGAQHLKVAGVDMSFYQYFLLDVIATLGLIISINFAIIYVACRKICCTRRHKKPKSD